VKVLQACYELLQANDFTYQHPPALADKTVSFDVRQVQNVKFPRDTIRDRSGTCIDLAILYAAMVNAVGLEPHLALIPGHCFPVVRLPTGNLVAVEVTGVGGGLRFGSADFGPMLEKGIEELKAAMEPGANLYLIDLHDLWTRGIANPELDEHPADILERWGIKEGGRGEPATQPATTGKDPVLGVFRGSVSEKDEEGHVTTYPMAVYTGVIRLDLEAPTESGGTVKIVLLEEFEASVEGGTVVGRATKRTLTNTETKESQEKPTQNRILFQADADHIAGKFGSDSDGWAEFSLPRAPK
jgi:hypothetical protein